jgi:hypothetical protein
MLEPINDYVETLRRTHGRDIPIIDPTFGGAEAPVLLVLRQPGPKGSAKTGKLSLDNPDRAAGALRLRLKEAGLTARHVAVWNIIPWTPTGPLKSPSDRELVEGAHYLQELLPILNKPRLAVVLMGGHARKARKHLEWPEWVRLFESPSPAPPEGTKPGPKSQIVRTLKEAHAWATESVQPAQPIVSEPSEPISVAQPMDVVTERTEESTATQGRSSWTLMAERVRRMGRSASETLSAMLTKLTRS